MKGIAMNIFKEGFKFPAHFRTLLQKLKGGKYIRQACSYLNISRKEFYRMVEQAKELSGNFYNEAQSACYIPHLVWYNRVLHDRNTSWVKIAEVINHYRHPKVLEFGCGAGCLTQYLLEKKCDFVSYAYDIPSKTLGFAKWRLKNTHFLDAVSEKDVFDITICLSVLEHIPLDECWKTVRLLEKISKRALIINFVRGQGTGHLQDTQRELSEVEAFLDRCFQKKMKLWAEDLFFYER